MSSHYVYILRSKINPTEYYIGQTENLKKRLIQHNKGDSVYTKRYKPWCIETYIVFTSRKLAKQFEKYLKSGSGKAFLRRRLMAEGQRGPEAK